MNQEQTTDNQELNTDTTQESGTCEQQCDATSSDNMSQTTDTESDTTVAEEPDWRDRFMRLSAEFDNFRKRTLKEKMDLMEYGGESVIKSFLKITDDYDRAVAAMQKSDDIEAIKQGIILIHTKLEEVLKQNNVIEIEAMGKDLDTDFHDAIAKVPTPDEQKGKVIDVVEKGYTLKDKVIRYAKVVVGE